MSTIVEPPSLPAASAETSSSPTQSFFEDPLRIRTMLVPIVRRKDSLKESLKGLAYFRLAIGLLCTALFVLGLVNLQRDNWREGIVTFFIGLLSGYYYTSAWYELRRSDKDSDSEET
jgi:hypothetical protein